MDHLKQILQKILKNTPQYENGLVRVEILEAWPRVVGEKVARHTWPVRMFDDGTLLIGAESSSWLQGLRYLEAQILEKYEIELKSKKVKQLRYKLEMKPKEE